MSGFAAAEDLMRRRLCESSECEHYEGYDRQRPPTCDKLRAVLGNAPCAAAYARAVRTGTPPCVECAWQSVPALVAAAHRPELTEV